MPVTGKKKYMVYLDEEKTEYVKSFLATSKYSGGFSGLLDDHVATLAKTLKTSKYVQGQKLTAASVIKVFINGLKRKPV